MSLSCLLPEFDIRQAGALAHRLFGLDGAIKQLAGERDLNFLIETDGGSFVFKIANASEEAQMLECQHQVFAQLADAAVFPKVACALPSVHGRLIETIHSEQGSAHLSRVLPYIEGCLLSAADPVSEALLEDLGKTLARLDLALQSFSHAALQRPILWNMCDALQTLADFKPVLTDQAQLELIKYFEAGFRKRVMPVQALLRRSVIHNDANDNNLLVDERAQRVISIIDFGDMLNAWLATEVAVAAAYAMLGKSEPIKTACAILRGYHACFALEDLEIEVMFDLICMRLCMSLCICAHQRSLEPDNAYLSVSEKPAWAILQLLRNIDYGDVQRKIRLACEMKAD